MSRFVAHLATIRQFDDSWPQPVGVTGRGSAEHKRLDPPKAAT
jgi:hypothetical protein